MTDTNYVDEAWVIIPARGGSKGIPRKNVKLLRGKPLIAYAIEAALAAPSVSKVFVSTDDAEISKVARDFGAEVIDRPSELSRDESSSESALLHALRVGFRQKFPGFLPRITVFMQCTSPLTAVDDVEGTIRKVREEGADSVFTGVASHAFLWKKEPNGTAVGVNHDPKSRPRRQDRIPEYRETGAVYAMKTEGFLRSEHRFFGKIAVHEVPEERGVDIDSLSDFAIAEVLLTNQ